MISSTPCPVDPSQFPECAICQVAMGVPLINAIYEDDPLIGLYTLPLLIWHPMQLLVGSTIAPRLARFVESEEERLGISHSNDTEVHAAQSSKSKNDIEASGPGTTERDDKENASSEENSK